MRSFKSCQVNAYGQKKEYKRKKERKNSVTGEMVVCDIAF